MKLEEALKTSKFNSPVHRATLNVLFTSYWLKNQFSQAIKSNNLTMEQFNVLRILKGGYPNRMCVKEIGSRMIEKSSNVPRILDRLHIKGLVDKTSSEKDKRETLITLTQKGVEILEKANKKVSETYEMVIGLDNEQAEMLNTLLEAMRLAD